jgi:hypothetical protein
VLSLCYVYARTFSVDFRWLRVEPRAGDLEICLAPETWPAAYIGEASRSAALRSHTGLRVLVPNHHRTAALYRRADEGGQVSGVFLGPEDAGVEDYRGVRSSYLILLEFAEGPEAAAFFTGLLAHWWPEPSTALAGVVQDLANLSAKALPNQRLTVEDLSAAASPTHQMHQPPNVLPQAGRNLLELLTSAQEQWQHPNRHTSDVIGLDHAEPLAARTTPQRIQELSAALLDAKASNAAARVFSSRVASAGSHPPPFWIQAAVVFNPTQPDLDDADVLRGSWPVPEAWRLLAETLPQDSWVTKEGQSVVVETRPASEQRPDEQLAGTVPEPSEPQIAPCNSINDALRQVRDDLRRLTYDLLVLLARVDGRLPGHPFRRNSPD